MRFPNIFGRLLAILLIATLAQNTQAADQPHLDDLNAQPDAPFVPGNFPKVTLTETQSLLASDQAWSKYDVIGGKAGMATKIARVQAINPDVQFHFSFHPQSYLGYLHNDPCEIAFGMPFNRSDATTGGCSIYAGHWLYRAGTTLATDASASTRTIRVQDAGTLQAGEYLVIYDAPLGSFNNAEHVQVISVNRSVVPHRVELATRGFKSNAVSHSAGSIVAMHERGRGGDPRNWAFNLALNSPRDATNRRVSSIMATWIRDNMHRNSRGQPTSVRVDGIYFDEDGHALFAQQVDANNDGVIDNGILPSGQNIWEAGLEEFYQQVRNRVPNLRVVGGWRESYGFPSLNGVQMENWLTTNGEFDVNPNYAGNSGALSQLQNYNLHTQYHRIGEGYVEALSKSPTRLYPYTVRSTTSPEVPATNATFRLGFAATLLHDGYYGRQNSDDHPDPWYDEYAVDTRSGSSTYGHAIASNASNESEIRDHKGWLGRPLGPRRRIYNNSQFEPSRTLITNGSFEQGTDGWLLRNVNTSIDQSIVRAGTRSLRVNGQQNFTVDLGGASVRGPQFDMIAGREYTLTFAARSSIIRDLFVRLDFSPNQGSFVVPQRWTRYVYTVTATSTGRFRPIFNLGRTDSTVWIDDVHVHEGNPNVFRRDFDNGIVVVNLTPQARTVPLNGTFQRIRGTGQDLLNSGAQVSSVTLPAYDAAILVRPDDTQVASSNPSGGCGAPSINLTGQPTAYGWADTCSPGLYHLVGTSIDTLTRYTGTLTSTATITEVTGDQLESNDSLQQTSPTAAAFDLRVRVSQDTISLRTAPNADVCLNLTSGSGVVRTGSTGQPASSNVNLRTGASCNCTAQAAPTTAIAANPGLHVWHDPCSQSFTIRATSDGPNRAFSGRVSANQSLSITGLNGIESHDEISGGGTQQVNFELQVWQGEDELRLSAPANATVCLALDPGSAGPIRYGQNGQTTARTIDLRTGNACQ